MAIIDSYLIVFVLLRNGDKMKLSMLALALLFSSQTLSSKERSVKSQKTQPYTMFSFNRPSPDCYVVEPAKHSKGVAKWECAGKPVRKEK